MDLPTLYQTQISLTEWFQRMGLANADAHRKEDNEKRERLAVLNTLIGLPFDRPTQFPAADIANRTDAFQKFVDERGDELCALRLIPHDSSLPKLRTRGASIRDSLTWFAQQDIDAARYKADFVPHPSDHVWSTIFVVHPQGAFGQIVAGSHNQLTQGFYDDGTEPITFSWDGTSIETIPKNLDAEKHLLEVLAALRVSDDVTRATIADQFNAKFFNEHLCGYFETVSSSEFGTWFIDWNRMLGDAYVDTKTPLLPEEGMGVVREAEQVGEPQDDGGKRSDSLQTTFRGQIGSKGKAIGVAHVVRAADLNSDTRLPTLDAPFILVTDMTTPDFLPLMMNAAGIITAFGGILCHAAIVCRELGKPCLTNVKNILDVVTDGTILNLDAETGTVRVLRDVE